ncbi:MAG TPA: hypothetical protein VL547_21815 [Dinghuibacter sp.]|uniref:hypothetical protein n=1 Tax=Dinghuibacter sp. TaxID=2024697 RepID=UPI002CF676C8|nr:hypothetical protein [Dinghuibacter sp.]HTJ14698.1 hypothetical protein [Dinghuibacter sp.]
MKHLIRYAWILLCSGASAQTIQYARDRLAFRWNVEHDSAVVTRLPEGGTLWQGSLLPAFWLEVGGRKQFVKTSMTSLSKTDSGWSIALRVGALGEGKLLVSVEPWGIRFKRLDVRWAARPPALIDMYYGVSDQAIKRSGVWPTWDRPFMPDWRSLLYCVPGAKGGTAKSYFRMWDFGQANVALGNFGPALGSPYGAAYPRPLLYAGMGADSGFVAVGAGSIPDAALSLRIQSTRGCFEYVYDEDIWGALPGNRRVWDEPLRICLGDNAWTAFKQYYGSFPVTGTASIAPRSFFNTWGVWRNKTYFIRPIADFAKSLGATTLVLDDPWETSQGSGMPNRDRFPHFDEDIAYIRDQGMSVGFWETVGWVKDPFALGLTKDDLLLDRNGHPCMANWNFDPSSDTYYCLDPSSAKVRDFLRRRTIHVMQTLQPVILKVDFMYGMPSPSMAVPRDPRYRGERLGAELVHLVAAAAKSVDPHVIIQGYGTSPLELEDLDMVSLDDQGDLWYDVAAGHQQWSMWGALLSDRHVALCGSSGYDWDRDDEAVLNSCVLGAPGASLPIDGTPDVYFDRRLAVYKWYRHTLNWTPVWMNSDMGGYTRPQRLNCWGRMEKTGGDPVLTALALRDGGAAPALPRVRWKGRWALISQDNHDIFSTPALAIIPFDTGMISIACPRPSAVTRLTRSGMQPFDGWHWSDGWLTIGVSGELLGQTGGFLINR